MHAQCFSWSLKESSAFLSLAESFNKTGIHSFNLTKITSKTQRNDVLCRLPCQPKTQQYNRKTFQTVTNEFSVSWLSEDILNSSPRGIRGKTGDLCTDPHVSHHTNRETVTYSISVMWFEIKTWWKVKTKKNVISWRLPPFSTSAPKNSCNFVVVNGEFTKTRKKVDSSSRDSCCLIYGINFKLSGQGSFLHDHNSRNQREFNPLKAACFMIASLN